MWAGVRDRKVLQHIDPHSYGHNSVSFPFSWAAQPRAQGPSLFECWFSLPHFISNWLNFLCTESYNCSTSTFFKNRTLSTVKVIFWYSLIGCTCYLHRCISYFDSPAGSEANIQQVNWNRRIRWQRLCLRHPTNFLVMTLNCIWWWGFSPGALGNVYHPFTAIPPRPALTRSGSIF